MSLDLRPEPQELIFVKGLYVLDAETRIVLPEAANAQASAVASQLQAEIQAAAGLAVPIIRAATPPARLNLIYLACGAEEVSALGLDPVETGAPPQAQEGAYALTIQRGRIVLYAPAAAGLARGAQALGQIVGAQGAALPTLVMRDWPEPGEGALETERKER
jgi:hypothetical protein